MENSEKIEHVNYLQEEIKKLEWFLHVVSKFEREESGIKSVKLFFKKKIKVQSFLFGTRFFGIGTHEQEIEIPNEIRNNIREIAQNRLSELQDELNDLFK